MSYMVMITPHLSKNNAGYFAATTCNTHAKAQFQVGVSSPIGQSLRTAIIILGNHAQILQFVVTSTNPAYYK